MNNTLISHFETLPDPRVDRTKKYPLIELILLIISATLSGCEGWKQIKDFGETKLEWLRQFLPYENGIPVDDTIARVMRKLDTKAFKKCFISWVKAISTHTNGDVIAIDGKTLRRSHNNKEEQSPIHMVSAWSNVNGLVLGQEKTADKSNEITAIPELLNVLELSGCIVTIDAMGCQKPIAGKIIKLKGDYILALKGNQGTLHEEVKDFFETAFNNHFKQVPHDYTEDFNSAHGRIESRFCWVFDANPEWFPSVKNWPSLNKIVVVKSKRELSDRVTNDTRFYIASPENLNAYKALSATRQHWGIESMHWTLDVTFREDESRIRKEASPENFAIIRHVALNVLKTDTAWKASLKRKRLRAALDDNYRETLIKQII